MYLFLIFCIHFCVILRVMLSKQLALREDRKCRLFLAVFSTVLHPACTPWRAARLQENSEFLLDERVWSWISPGLIPGWGTYGSVDFESDFVFVSHFSPLLTLSFWVESVLKDWEKAHIVLHLGLQLPDVVPQFPSSYPKLFIDCNSVLGEHHRANSKAISCEGAIISVCHGRTTPPTILCLALLKMTFVECLGLVSDSSSFISHIPLVRIIIVKIYIWEGEHQKNLGFGSSLPQVASELTCPKSLKDSLSLCEGLKLTFI